MGDTVLKGLVTLIRKRARRLDLLFRTGGEEFVLLLPDTQQRDAVKLAEALCAGVEHARLLDDAPVTISIGVAGMQNDASNPVNMDSWLKRADDALYAAKRAGRNRVVCSV